MPNGVIAHNAKGKFDVAALKKKAAVAGPGRHGPRQGRVGAPSAWTGTRSSGTGRLATPAHRRQEVVAIDYGLKRNILRCLTSAGCDVTVVPATAKAEDILAMKPDGVFLSNGPGDPAATGEYAVPEIRKLVDSGKPVFGICLGHQMLGIALGAKTHRRCIRATTAPTTR
jgi:carbamoyl-phosphate synthase small subunit